MNELQKKYPECVDPNYCRDISLKERKRMRRAEERRGDLVNLSDRQITDSLGPFTPTLGQSMVHSIQPADIGWPTGNGKKVSNSQACCCAWQQLGFFLFPVGNPMSTGCTVRGHPYMTSALRGRGGLAQKKM